MVTTDSKSEIVCLQEKSDEEKEPLKSTKQIAHLEEGTEVHGSPHPVVTEDLSVLLAIASCFKWLWKKKGIVMAIIIIAVLAVLNIFVIIKWLSVQKKSTTDPSPTSQCFLYIISCPKNWVGYEGRCYYFSGAEGTWDFAQRQCCSYNASLASIDTPEEMDFLMRYKISADHWFGLRRQKVGEPWKWTNDSLFNNWFEIRAKGFCAYLDDEGASSTRCDTERNWICTKPLYGFGMEKPPASPTNILSFENCTISWYQLISDPFGVFVSMNFSLLHVQDADYYFQVVVSPKSYPLCPSCPEDWIGWEGKCYYFSVGEANWSSSKSHCNLHGASLVTFNTVKELLKDFVKRYKDRTDYWIGLWREEKGQLWKQQNGSIFNDLFKVGSDGTCAYLNDKEASSTWCNTQRNWICSKSLHAP